MELEVAVPTSMKVAVLELDEWAPEPKTAVPAPTTPTTVAVPEPDEDDGEDNGEGALAPEAVGLEAMSAPMVNVTWARVFRSPLYMKEGCHLRWWLYSIGENRGLHAEQLDRSVFHNRACVPKGTINFRRVMKEMTVKAYQRPPRQMSPPQRHSLYKTKSIFSM